MKEKQIDFIIIEEGTSRIDKWLLKRYPNINNSIAQKLLRKGDVKVNNIKVKNNYILQKGDIVKVARFLINKFSSLNKKKVAKKVDITKYQDKIDLIKESIIYQDDNLLILNKPSSLAVQGGSNISFHLGLALKFLRGENQNNPLFVHRIDKETSGILILARNKKSCQYMFDLFKNKEIKKIYFCLVSPFDAKQKGTIDKSLLKVDNGSYQYIKPDKNGKSAITEYQVITKKNKVALLEVSPLTGRTHQIRVHMAKVLKSPIIGDFKYGFDDNLNLDIDTKKLYLHAKSVSFIAPCGRKISVSADFDDNFKTTLNNIGIKL